MLSIIPRRWALLHSSYAALTFRLISTVERGRTRLGGRETDHLVRGEALSAIGAKCQPERTGSYKIISVSILKSINTKWIHFKSAAHPFYRTDDKGGVIEVHTTQSTNTLTGMIQSSQTMTFFWVLQSTITASITWSIFAFGKQQWLSRYDSDNYLESRQVHWKATAHVFIYLFF